MEDEGIHGFRGFVRGAYARDLELSHTTDPRPPLSRQHRSPPLIPPSSDLQESLPVGFFDRIPEIGGLC